MREKENQQINEKCPELPVLTLLQFFVEQDNKQV